ncbi:MAG TPA: RNA polymerase sigma factor [Terriglobia bacterium]|nr:RNA polymerase sigma factor [Terriglobia bacterium]
MAFDEDKALLAHSALSVSEIPGGGLSPDAEEIARLVRLVLGGERAAFERIIARYERRVMLMALRLLGARDDAQDAAQEVFLRAFKYLHRLDLGKPVEPWLLRMTVNVCRDIGRRKSRQRETSLDGVAPESLAADSSGDPHAGLTGEQERQMLWRALDSLPEKERRAIILRDVEGLSTSEVAAILGSTETTVRSQISRGRLRVKEAIDRMRGGRE